MRGYTEWAWIAAVTTNLIVFLPLSYQLLFLDSDIRFAFGFVVFGFIRRASCNTVGVVQQLPGGFRRRVTPTLLGEGHASP
jgi:hypothetical protein